MLNPSKRITKSVILFASKHSSQLINQAILQAFDGLIGRYVYNFHKKYPEIEIEDLNQIARERALICIKKWTPKGNSFSFPQYLKQALFFGLRRYCHGELRHLKCIQINKDASLMLKNEKIKLGLDDHSSMRIKEFDNDTTVGNTKSIGYKVSKFIKKLLVD